MGPVLDEGADSSGAVSFMPAASEWDPGDHTLQVTTTDTDGLYVTELVNFRINAPADDTTPVTDSGTSEDTGTTEDTIIDSDDDDDEEETEIDTGIAADTEGMTQL